MSRDEIELAKSRGGRGLAVKSESTRHQANASRKRMMAAVPAAGIDNHHQPGHTWRWR